MNINKDNSLNSTVRISCKKVGEKTLLEERFFDIPYKLNHFGNSLETSFLEMILMCSSPGVMDGDTLTMDIHCQENTEMKFYTQSYNKIHPMPQEKGARQFCNFSIEDGAKFLYIPHPTIPYEKSIFTATNTIKVKETSHLIWGDIISGGRIFSGERFLFKKYHTKTKIFRNDKLVLFDNQMIEPESQPVEDLLFFEGYTHQATLVIVSRFADDFKKELDEILLEQFTDSSYGFTLCAENALMLRVMGTSGDALHDWLSNIGNMAWEYIKHRENTEEKPLEEIENKEIKALPNKEKKSIKDKKTTEKKKVAKKSTAKKETTAKTKKTTKAKEKNARTINR
ncbi:MAG: urease accessory protein UreD [Bergeyella zoohelcum]|nr:urease accessory protein UreD [Bergeyella zoohelcum]